MTQPPTGSPDPYQHDPYREAASSAPRRDPFAPPSGGQSLPGPEQASTWGTPPNEPAQAYQAQPTYQQPYGGYPTYGAPAPSRTNAVAITGFVLAVVGLLGCWIPGVNVLAAVLALAGLVLGVVGLLQVKKGKSGKGLALAAIVVGALAIVGTVVSWVVFARWIDDVSTGYEQSFAQLEEEPGDTSAVAPDDEPSPVEEPATEEDLAVEVPAGTTPFGETVVYEDGLEVGVTAPVPFTPGEWSAGGEDYPAHVRFDVTVTNGTDAPFDPSMVFLTASSAGTEADQVFDSEGGLDGGPMTAVLPGQSVTFPVGFGVTDPADLLVQVAPGPFEYDDALFSTAP